MKQLRFEISITGKAWLQGEDAHRPVHHFTLLIDGKENNTMWILHPGKKRTVTITDIVDAAGIPTTPLAIPTYTADVEGNVSLAPSADGLSCDVVYLKGSLTPTTVTATVDGITEIAQFQTTGGAVGDFKLSAGPEVDAAAAGAR